MANPYMINVADFSQGMQGIERGLVRGQQREAKRA